MKYLLTLILSITYIGCGTQKVEQKQSGSVNVNINFGFLDQMHKLCTDYYSNVQFPSQEDHDHTVAECVFSHLQSAGTTTTDIANFDNKYCQPDSNFSGLSVEQITQVQAACHSLGLL